MTYHMPPLSGRMDALDYIRGSGHVVPQDSQQGL